MDSKLVDFLKHNNVWEQFGHNVRTLNTEITTDMDLSIGSAFAWAKSPEGYVFWSDLAYEFSKDGRN